MSNHDHEPEVQPVTIAEGLRFPEGPAFDPDGFLWCVELKGGGLVRVDPESGELTRIDTGGTPNGIAIDAYGRIWFADAAERAIRRYDPEDRKVVTVVDLVYGEPLNKPNDLAFDRRGNLVFTCPGDSRAEPTGYVCCLQPDGSIEQIANELMFPNGLAFIHGGESLLIAETYKQRIWRGEWDDDACVWTEEEIWARDLDGAPGGPDGLAIGADGNAYVAIFGGGRLVSLSADGLVAEAFSVPGARPTNCAFDPLGRLGLVVTEAETGQLLSIPGLGPGVPLFNGGSAWAL